MKPLATGGFAEALQANVRQPLPHVLGGLDDIGKLDVRRGIEIEHQAPRCVVRIRGAIPGMQLQPADLRHRRQSLDTINLQVRLAIAGHLGQFQEIGGALHSVTLKEFLTLDAIRRADNGTRPAFQMADHPAPHRFEIAGEIELGYAFAVTAVRPQLLVGLGDNHAHHFGGFALRLSGPRLTGFGRGLAGGFGDFGDGRIFRPYLVGRLVLAQPLERSLPDIPAVGPADELDFGDEFGPYPMHVAGFARRILAAERALVRGCGL